MYSKQGGGVVRAAFISAVVLSSACSKENLVSDSKVQNTQAIEKTQLFAQPTVENGVLVFTDEQQFQTLAAELETYNENQLNTWSKTIGYKPLQSKIYKVFHEIEKQDTLNPSESDNFNAMNQLLAANSTIARIETDEAGEQRIVPIVDDTHYGNLLNENAVAIIGDKAIKIIDNYKITAPKADVGLLAKTTSVENAKAWEVVQYKNVVSDNKGGYGNEIQESTKKDPRWCNNDRRVFCNIQVHSGPGTNPSRYRYEFKYRITGERKSASCIWYHYNTGLQTQNTWANIHFIDRDWDTTLPAKSSNGDVWELLANKYSQDMISSTNPLFTCYFSQVHAEYKSTGVPWWGILERL